MNVEDPLAQLRDIHLPDPVSWWPLAPGWWVLIGIAFLLIVLLILFVLRLRARAKTRRSIKYAQQQFERMSQQEPCRNQLVESLQLFRRISLIYQSNTAVASTPLTTLALTIGKQNDLSISTTTLELMDDLQYRPNVEIAGDAWRQLMADLSNLVNEIDNSNLTKGFKAGD